MTDHTRDQPRGILRRAHPTVTWTAVYLIGTPTATATADTTTGGTRSTATVTGTLDMSRLGEILPEIFAGAVRQLRFPRHVRVIETIRPRIMAGMSTGTMICRLEATVPGRELRCPAMSYGARP